VGRSAPRALSLLRRERERRGWTQAYLAERLEVDPAYISRWERGVVSPTGLHRRRLCEVFERDAEELGLLRPAGAGEPAAARAPASATRTRLTGRVGAAAVLALSLAICCADAALWAPAAQAASRRAWPTERYDLTAQSDVVRAVQLLLIAHGQDVGPTGADGIFGAATQAGVQSFQRSGGLRVSGEVDRSTWERLVVPLGPGSRGPQVEALQRLLRAVAPGPAPPIDGRFDAGTESAIRGFQRQRRLASTGRADLDTWCLLVGGAL
jgi:peptidoglycan hydrolase-like protein with peptidoglycan-binding domain/DNA-binding XRE family transcriptional regulator